MWMPTVGVNGHRIVVCDSDIVILTYGIQDNYIHIHACITQ